VVTDPRFLRPSEVDQLISDPTRANERLGWKPKIHFNSLVEMMVEADLKRLKNGR
jgi:GDPmannose 4,6-dehydratase